MKRTKRKLPRRRSRAKSEGHSGEFFLSPFNDINPEAFRAALIAIGNDKVESFPQHLDAVFGLLRAKDPLQILATLAVYGPAHVSRESPQDKKPLVEQHHVELLQALALKLQPNEWGVTPAEPNDIQASIDGINELAEAYHQRRYALIKDEVDSELKAALMLRERIRLHTQVVRNWGYFSQVTGVSRELYGPLEAAITAKLGFSPLALFSVAEWLIKTFEKRGSQRINSLRRVFREKTIRRMVRAYYAAFPYLKGNPEDLVRVLPEGSSHESVMAMIITHADLSLSSLIEFTSADVSEGTGLASDDVDRVLAAISLKPGDIKGEPEGLFLDNPVWIAPGIFLGDRWVFPAPQVIFSHIHDVLRHLAVRAELGEEVAKRRAMYLEDKVAGLIASALPGAHILLNQKWGAEGYETDLIAVLDRTIVIVESKSAALTGPGLRGAPDRMRRHIKDLITDPSVQSGRLTALIRRANAGDAVAKASLPDFGIPLEDVRTVIRLSVTLDDFSVFALSERELKETGWLPADLELAPTMNIADLASVTEILDRPALFLHYLAERERFQKAIRILGDELDLLGLYLETGFNTLGTEDTFDSFAISGKSRALDHFFNCRDAGVAVRKPKPQQTPYFEALIVALETKKPAGWIDISLDLLRLSDFNEQRKLIRGLESVRANVLRNWRDPKHVCSVVVKPHPKRDTGAVIYIYPPQLAVRRREVTRELASEALAEYGLARCLIIGRRTDAWDEPYSFIGVGRLGDRFQK